jgi:mRNA interferase MazF
MMPPLRWALIEASLDPARGSEQRGRRPVLVVSNEEFNQAVPNLTVLPLTTTPRRLYPSEVFLPRGVAGQPMDSIIMAHQMRTISKERLGDPLGYLEDPSLRSAVEQAIREHFDLDQGVSSSEHGPFAR